MKFIAANWKMNKTSSETAHFLKELLKFTIPKERTVLICPPFTALQSASEILNNSGFSLGGQNMHFEEKGAFTGEISPLMLKELGCKYVILGHSERRHIFGEQNSLINKKMLSAIKHSLTPILCVGETLDEREKGKAKSVIKKQLKECLKDVSGEYLIAYEPVWAIGTGVNATAEQAQEIHAYISELVGNEKIILYGGSATPENAKELLSQQNINGLLVGGASLDLEKFKKIVSS